MRILENGLPAVIMCQEKVLISRKSETIIICLCPTVFIRRRAVIRCVFSVQRTRMDRMWMHRETARAIPDMCTTIMEAIPAVSV